MKNKEKEWKLVEERYKDKRLLRLDILYHILELKLKADHAISHDRCPFEEDAFLKELADIHILLEILKKHDPQFKNTVYLRKNSLIEKVAKDRKNLYFI